jgi:SWI/SNF-related matrix-associated actin-dependent regulator of chromatin subfamily A-like protein 1
LKLFDYQRTGADWLAGRKHALLGDKMGLGKTIQAIEGCNLVQAQRVAVVCPAIARINWRREFDKWGIYSPEVWIESFNKLALDKELRKRWAAFKPDVLIVDEAHFLKTASASRTKALYGPHCRGDGLVRCAGRVWLLSGTIAPNNGTELFSHFRALWPEELPGNGTYADWVNRYAHFIKGDHDTIKVLANKNEGELREKLARVMLRRRTEDVLPDLPPTIYGDLTVDNDAALAEVKALEESIEVQELIYRLEEGAPTPEGDPHLAAFRRVCGLAKAGPVAAVVHEELESGQVDKIVLFAHHREVIERLMQGLQRFNPVRVWGGDSDRTRQDAIDRFQTDPSVRVFVGQITACSTAVTLTAAHHCVFVEQSWVPTENDQATHRLSRISQKCIVFARIAILAGSIDEAIQGTLTRKVRALSQLYGASA